MLKAHGKAYRLYRRKYYEKQNGKIGITFNGIFAYPLDYGTSAIELERADRAIQFMVHFSGFLFAEINTNQNDYFLVRMAGPSHLQR